VIRLTSRDTRENAAFLHLEGGNHVLPAERVV
jgi:hypothetical protein